MALVLSHQRICFDTIRICKHYFCNQNRLNKINVQVILNAPLFKNSFEMRNQMENPLYKTLAF